MKYRIAAYVLSPMILIAVLASLTTANDETIGDTAASDNATASNKATETAVKSDSAFTEDTTKSPIRR